MLDDLKLWQGRFEECLFLRGLSARTVEYYVAELEPLFVFLLNRGLEKLSEVNREALEAYRRELYYGDFRGKRLSLGSQARRLTAIKVFFGYLADAQFILVDSSTSLKRPRVPKTLPRQLLSEGEMMTLLLGPDIATPLGIRNRAILELLYATGIRNSELLNLELGSVDFDRCELFISRGKGNKSRRLPLAEEALAWLEDYLLNARPQLARAHSGDVFFLTVKGNKFYRGQLSDMVRELAVSLGLEKRVTPHLLRHACATHMLRRGAGVRQLQLLLGHSDINSTQRYLKVEISDLHKVVTQYHPREQGFAKP